MNTLKFGNGEWYGKKDTILAYNDLNSNYKPLPFNFSRASNATVINKDGLIEEVGSEQPRVDYKDNTKGALLLEPTRSNIITYSENLNGAGWNVYSSTGGTCTRTLNYGISPSGKQDSTRVVFSTGTTALYFSSNITGNASATMYVKGISGEVIGFGWGESVASGTDFTFNGEWQRLEYNGTSANSTLSINDWGETRNARDFEIYGVQMEQGSYATSYIPTSGSVVTRLADECSQTVPDGVIGQTEGTIYADVNINGLKNDNTLISVNNGTFSEYIIISGNISGKINAYIFDNGSQQVGILSPNYSLGRFKCALSYSLNSVSFYINGTKIGSDTSATIPTTNILSLGSLSFFTAPLSGKINQSLVYNRALTDQELAALTQV
jgi:hypothetical protein